MVSNKKLARNRWGRLLREVGQHPVTAGHVKLPPNAQPVLLKNSTRSRPQGRNADYTSISNNVAPVKHFLRRTTPSALKSAPFRSPWNLLPSSTKGSRVISQVELSPTQPSLRSQRRS